MTRFREAVGGSGRPLDGPSGHGIRRPGPFPGTAVIRDPVTRRRQWRGPISAAGSPGVSPVGLW